MFRCALIFIFILLTGAYVPQYGFPDAMATRDNRLRIKTEFEHLEASMRNQRGHLREPLAQAHKYMRTLASGSGDARLSAQVESRFTTDPWASQTQPGIFRSRPRE